MIEVSLTTKLGSMFENTYPLAAPLDFVSPCIVYTRIDTNPTDDLDGLPDTAFMMFQIDVYSETHLEALTMAGRLRHAILEWQDDYVAGATLQNQHSMVDDTRQTRLYRVCQDFMFFAPLD